MTTTPLYCWLDTVIAADDYIRIDDVGIIVDGSHPFSMTGWVQPLSEGDGVPWVVGWDSQQEPIFQLMFYDATQGGVSIALDWRGNQWMGTLDFPLEIGSWHFVGVTFQPSTMKVSLYIDGALALQQSVLAPSAAVAGTFILSEGYVRMSSFSFWTTCLTGSQLIPTWGPPALGTAGLDTCVDLSVLPPRDVVGGHPVSVGDTTRAAWSSPALILDGTGVLIANPSDGLNPGNGTEPFTVQMWVYAQQQDPDLVPDAQVLLANADINGSCGLAVYLSPSDAGRWTLNTRLGGTGAAVISSPGPTSDAWQNIAVTFDGTTITHYLDGSAAGTGQPGTPAPISAAGVIVGGAQEGADGEAFGFQLTGYLQAVTIWSRALSPQQVTAALTAEPDLTDATCSAYFPFNVIDTLNRVTGRPATPCLVQLGLQITESLIEQPDVTSGAPTREWRPLGSSHAPDRSELDAWLDALISDAPETAPTDGPLTADDIEALVADYTRLAHAALPEALREHYVALFRTRVLAGLQAVADGRHLPGTVTWTRDEGGVVFWLHTPAGVQEVHRTADPSVDECIAWLASVVATALGLLFVVLGLGYSLARLSGFFATLFTGNLLARAGALSEIMQSGVSAWTIIKVIRTLAGIVGLGPMVTNALAGVSWWSWAWTVASAVAQIAAIWVSGGWYLAYMVAQLGIAIAQLTAVIQNKPKDCFSISRPPLGLGQTISPSGSPAAEGSAVD